MKYLENDALALLNKRLVFIFGCATIFFAILYMFLTRYNSSYMIYNIRLSTIIIGSICFLITCLLSYNLYFRTLFSWYCGVGVAVTIFNLFALEIFNPTSFKIAGHILFVILDIIFVVIFLWISKKNFKKFVHTINIIFLSTYSLFVLSIVFSSYYNEVYNLVSEINKNNFFTIYFSSCKTSFRYFFEFPPDEYLDVFTIFQFILGRIYDAVLIGGIASLVVKTIGSSDEK